MHENKKKNRNFAITIFVLVLLVCIGVYAADVGVISNVIINSTFGTSFEDLNLTWTSSVPENYNITDWRIKNVSIAILNLPFEGDSLNNVTYYSTYKINGTLTKNASSPILPLWNATGGQYGSGSYRFNGLNGINLTELPVTQNISVVARIYPNVYSGQIIDYGIAGFGIMLTSGALRVVIYNNTNVYNNLQTAYDLIPANNWYYISAVSKYDALTGTSFAQLYINGVQKVNTTFGGWPRHNPGSLDSIGYYRFGGATNPLFYNGTIDNLVVYNRALSPEEILLLNSSIDSKMANQELYAGENWSACVTPNNGSLNGVEVCSNNLFIRNIINFTSVYPNNTGAVQPITNEINISLVRNHSMTTNLTFNVSVNVTDTQPITFSWFVNQVLAFWETLTSGFTSMFSFLFTNVGTYNVTVVVNGSGVNQTFTFLLNTTNVAPVMNSVFINSTYGANSTWENLTAYWNASDYDNDTLYNVTDWRVNGESFARLNLPFEGNGTNNASDYSSNKFGVYAGITRPFWNITGGYNGRGAYQFGYTNNTDSLYVDTLDYSKFSNLSDGTKTVSFWFNPRTLQSMIIMGTMYRNCVWNSSGWYIGENVDGGGGRIEFTFLNSTYLRNATTCGVYTTAFSSYNTAPVNTWTHIIIMFNKTNVVFYKNGVLNTNYVNTEGVLQAQNEIQATYSTPRLYIGNSVLSNYYRVNGSIDNIMFFNRTISQQEITLLYQNNTFMIPSQELKVGENWSACITPNDGYADGNTLCSNNITIGTSYWPGGTFNLPCNTAGGSYGFGHNLAGNLFNISGAGEALGIYGRIYNYSGLTITNCRVYLYNGSTG